MEIYNFPDDSNRHGPLNAFVVDNVLLHERGHILILCNVLLQKGKSFEPEQRCSFVEGARDVAVLEAMLESGMREGALVQVKRF